MNGPTVLHTTDAPANADHALLAEFREIVIDRPRDFCPQTAPHVQIGLQTAVLRLRLETQPMVGTTKHLFPDIG